MAPRAAATLALLALCALAPSVRGSFGREGPGRSTVADDACPVSCRCVPPSTWLMQVAFCLVALAAAIVALSTWASARTDHLPWYLSWLRIAPIAHNIDAARVRATEAHIKDMLTSKLSPSENAANLLAKLAESERLTATEKDMCRYARDVLQLNQDSAVVPRNLLTDLSGGEVDEQVSEWLRQEYTPLRKRNKKGLKAHVQGVVFALRLRNKSHNTAIARTEGLPFEMPPDKVQDVMTVLDRVDEWDFDIFALREAADGRELEILGWYILNRWKLIDKFNIDKTIYKAWLAHVSASYLDNAYHNSTHAADILQTTHFMLSTGGLSTYLSDIEVLAMLLAAMIHDAGHDGMSNIFHKNCLTERALAYNDQSIQENYHVASIFQAMRHHDEINIFRCFNHKQYVELRLMLIEMVLGTDMSKHFTEINEFRNLLSVKGKEESAWVNDTMKLMGMVLHACDISAQAKPYPMALKWGDKVHREFFRQGDKEKELGLPVSPMCDRRTTNIDASQVGFIKFIVHPAFQAVADLLPVVQQVCMPHLEKNLDNYQFQLQRNGHPQGDAK